MEEEKSLDQFESELILLIQKRSYDIITEMPANFLSEYICNCIAAYNITSNKIKINKICQ